MNNNTNQCRAQLVGFGSTHVGIILYLVVLKIWIFSTTKNKALCKIKVFLRCKQRKRKEIGINYGETEREKEGKYLM